MFEEILKNMSDNLSIAIKMYEDEEMDMAINKIRDIKEFVDITLVNI